jgi:hypothetical protein
MMQQIKSFTLTAESSMKQDLAVHRVERINSVRERSERSCKRRIRLANSRRSSELLLKVRSMQQGNLFHETSRPGIKQVHIPGRSQAANDV